jgi:hypothetical protein
LNYLIDQFDLSAFDMVFRNDQLGAPAYPPDVMLKIIFYCYSRGIITSRPIEDACKSNIIVKALARDAEPDHDTIAHCMVHNIGKCTPVLLFMGTGAAEGKEDDIRVFYIFNSFRASTAGHWFFQGTPQSPRFGIGSRQAAGPKGRSTPEATFPAAPFPYRLPPLLIIHLYIAHTSYHNRRNH